MSETPYTPTEAELAGIEQQVMQMGANDSERDQFESIWSRYRKGEITLLEAIKEAFQIRDSKQSYH